MIRASVRSPYPIVAGFLVLAALYSAYATVALLQTSQAARLGVEGERFRIVLLDFCDVQSIVERWVQDESASPEEVETVQAVSSRMLSELNLLLNARRERKEPSMSVVEEAQFGDFFRVYLMGATEQVAGRARDGTRVPLNGGQIKELQSIQARMRRVRPAIDDYLRNDSLGASSQQGKHWLSLMSLIATNFEGS